MTFTIVQAVSTHQANGSPNTVTLNQATGLSGPSTLVACITADQSTTAPTVASITLGASADNWQACVSDAGGTSPNISAAIWYDPGCASGQTSVALNITAGTGGGEESYIAVYEVLGVLAFDKGSTGDRNSSATWSSGSTATTSQANEIFFGCCTGSTAIPTVTGVGTWTTQPNGAGTLDQISGFQVVSSIGTATFSGTIATGKTTAAVATFSAAAPPPVSRPPLHLGGTATDETINGSAFVQTIAGSTTVPTINGSITVPTINGSRTEWTMQAVTLTLGENNDVTVDLTLTEADGTTALDLTDATSVDVFLKTAAGVADDDGSTIKLTSTGGSPAVTITNASAGLAEVVIPGTDIDTTTIGFWRADVVDADGNRNTAMYGTVTVTPL